MSGEIVCAGDDFECNEGVIPHLRRLRADMEKLKAVVRMVEWSAQDDYGSGLCPVCSRCRGMSSGHAPDCALAKALGK